MEDNIIKEENSIKDVGKEIEHTRDDNFYSTEFEDKYENTMEDNVEKEVEELEDDYFKSKTLIGLPSRISDVFCYLINVTFSIFPIYSIYLLFVSDEKEDNILVAW